MESIEQVKRERDLLAEAIRNAAVDVGIISPDVSLTGPMLLLLCDDLATLAKVRKSAF